MDFDLDSAGVLSKFAQFVRLRSRLYWASPWANRKYISEASPVIVGGAVRAGTTVIRTMLDTHPHIAAGPESWVFVYRLDDKFLADEYGYSLEEIQTLRRACRCLPEFAERFLSGYAQRMGKARWAEK